MLLETALPPETATLGEPFHGEPVITNGAVPPLGIMVIVPSLLLIHVSLVCEIAAVRGAAGPIIFNGAVF
jgi:hypothetical protein